MKGNKLDRCLLEAALDQGPKAVAGESSDIPMCRRHVPLVYILRQCSFGVISCPVSPATLWVMTATDDFVLPFKLGVKLTQYLVLVPLETAIEPPVREV